MEYKIKSTTSDRTYTVKVIDTKNNTLSCTCPYFRYHTSCKHANSVRKKLKLPSVKPTKRANVKRERQKHMKFKWYSKLKNPQDWYMSEKLDGFFVRWDHSEKELQTANGVVIPIPKNIKDKMPTDHDLDAELYKGVKKRDELNAIIQGNGDWKGVDIYAFDVPNTGLPFETRRKLLINSSKKHGYTIIPYKRVQSNLEITSHVEKMSKHGQEGIVLKHKDNIYKPGTRSSTSLKYKPTQFTAGNVLALTQKKKGYRVAEVRETVTDKVFNLTIPPKCSQIKQGDLIRIKFHDRDSKGRPEHATLRD